MNSNDRPDEAEVRPLIGGAMVIGVVLLVILLTCMCV
jgi:hypothetical protein